MNISQLKLRSEKIDYDDDDDDDGDDDDGDGDADDGGDDSPERKNVKAK